MELHGCSDSLIFFVLGGFGGLESWLSLVLHDQIDLEMLKCVDFYFRAAVKLCKVNRLPIFL